MARDYTTAITAIPAGWTLPTDLAEAVKARDEVVETYQDATEAEAAAKAAVREATRADAEAIREAARTGKPVAPPTEPAAKRNAQVADARVRGLWDALLTADGAVTDLLREHWPSLARQTREQATAGLEEYRETMEDLATRQRAALAKWQASAEGFEALRGAARQAGLSYPDAPVPDHQPDLAPPAGTVSHIQRFCDYFERFGN